MKSFIFLLLFSSNLPAAEIVAECTLNFAPSSRLAQVETISIYNIDKQKFYFSDLMIGKEVRNYVEYLDQASHFGDGLIIRSEDFRPRGTGVHQKFAPIALLPLSLEHNSFLLPLTISCEGV